MHDIPYTFSVGPEVCASMTVVCAAVRGICPSLPLGVQILSAANSSAVAVALASGWYSWLCLLLINTCMQECFRLAWNFSLIERSVLRGWEKQMFSYLFHCCLFSRYGFYQGRGICLLTCCWWRPFEWMCRRPFAIPQANTGWTCADFHWYKKEAQVSNRSKTLQSDNPTG